jgi:hypothetical protein
MAETATEKPEAFVVRMRGGIGDGAFRLALGRVPPRFVAGRESDGARQTYEYAGPEDQVEHSNVYDPNTKRNERVSRVAAVYHIFRPAAE